MTAINKFNTSMIYSIRSPHTVNYYIGSTTQKLCKRFSDHNINYKAYLKGTGGFTTSFKILELGDAYIELLEEINCDNRNQLEKREGELIREHKNNCVNKYIAGRTKKEYKIDNIESIKAINKQYKIDNKESILKQNKQYRTDNNDKIKEQQKQYRIDNKDLLTENNKKYYIHNKELVLKKHKQYQIDNKESISKQHKQYYIDNKDKIIQYRIDNKANNKQYRIDNSESISIQSKQYYRDNIESIKAKAKLPYLCACGSTFRTCDKVRHNKSAKHIKALELEIKIV